MKHVSEISEIDSPYELMKASSAANDQLPGQALFKTVREVLCKGLKWTAFGSGLLAGYELASSRYSWPSILSITKRIFEIYEQNDLVAALDNHFSFLKDDLKV